MFNNGSGSVKKQPMYIGIYIGKVYLVSNMLVSINWCNVQKSFRQLHVQLPKPRIVHV